MKILLCYVTVTNGSITADYVSRFVGTWLAAPPGMPHETLVVCNGGPPSREIAAMFDPMEASFFPRVNDGGWDISAYIDVAGKTDADMLVCLGESIHFWRPGWLERMATAWDHYGPGMYGSFTSFLVRPHINTTGFAIPPRLLAGYPKPTNKDQRYNFEHGEYSFWKHVQSKGSPTKLVTWDGVWDPAQWRFPSNILWSGDQSNCLMLCSHTERYRLAAEGTKQTWKAHADRGGFLPAPTERTQWPNTTPPVTMAR